MGKLSVTKIKKLLVKAKYISIYRAVIFFFLFPLHLVAFDHLTINGYYKNFFTVIKFSDYDKNTQVLRKSQFFSDINRFRLKFVYELNSCYSFHASYDGIYIIQDPSLFDRDFLIPGVHTTDTQQYRIGNIDPRIYPAKDHDIGSSGMYQNLDRFFLRLENSWGDTYIGRQAIAWGSARVVNPTDIIVPFQFNALDTEERIGVDSIRMRIPTGSMSEIDIGFVAGEEFKSKTSAIFIRSKTALYSKDISFILIDFRKHLLGGFDIAGSLGGAGFWFENAYVWTNTFNTDERRKKDDYYRGSLGCDYTFTEKMYGFIELHYSQAGEGKPRDYISRKTIIPYTQGAVYLLGTWYGAPGITYQITPLVLINGYVLWNINDDSVSVTPGLEYNVAEDMYVSCGAYVGLGRSSGNDLQSEFGSYTDIYFASFKIYF